MLLSVLIPARNEAYLQATIDDILRNFTCGDYEIVVGLDEYWPDPPLVDDPRVVVYHSDERLGMKPLINRLAQMARGKHLMKVDAHCMFDEGYDSKLLEIMQPGHIVLGVRYEMDVKKWERRERTNCDFRYLSHPSDPEGGLRGLAWHDYKRRVKGQEVAETMTISGSSYIVERSRFLEWGGLYEGPETGTFGQEGAEICLKCWLSGGRVLVNRRTWYAHWNRGKRPYSMGANQRDKSVAHSVDYWLNDRWPLQKYSFRWLIDRFSPVPGWEEQIIETVPAVRQGTLYKGLRNKYREADTDFPTEWLWEHRIGMCEPLKRERLKIFYDAFLEVVEAVLAGKRYTRQEMEQTRYWRYLATHLPPSWQHPLNNAGRRHLINKFRDAEALTLNILDNGMKAPLECYAKDGAMILWRGYRRLVIAKALGLPRMAIVQHLSEETAKGMPRKFSPPVPGSITEIAQKQFAKWGGKATDKYWTHGYTETYDNLFSSMRRGAIKLLELGVARGASLLLWHEAFPKAKIYGLDKDAEIWKEMAGNLDRVKMFVGKQQDEELLKQVCAEGPYNIIIDDAGHTPQNQAISFKALWPSVAPHGYYVIEDAYRSYKGERPVIVHDEIYPLVQSIYRGYTVRSVQYFYNMIVVQKGLA